MAQILFSKALRPFSQCHDGYLAMGRYAEPKHYEHMMTIQYDCDPISMNPVEFLDFLVINCSGVILVNDNTIWFNSPDTYLTIISAFDKTDTKYNDKLLHEWVKNPNTKSFERYKPYDGVWQRY